jgi:hypothetical protein
MRLAEASRLDDHVSLSAAVGLWYGSVVSIESVEQSERRTKRDQSSALCKAVQVLIA